MKRIFVIALIVLGSFFHYNAHSQSLKIIGGDRLCYQNGANFYEIKKVKDGSSFHGYDMVDSSRVFIAYDPETGAEVSTKIAVYDVKKQSEKILGELGATGESFFVYSKETDFVAFNWYDGIYVFRLHNANKEIIRKIEPRLIVKCDSCELPFWVDASTIGYQDYKNKKVLIRYIKITK